MRYLSLFSGIGGFELGIKKAYENISKTEGEKQRGDKRGSPSDNGQRLPREQLTCVGYSEIDKYADETYKKHFNHTNYGDTTKIITRQLPEFDLLVGGFPCQAFSVAGKRGGFNDTRGTLFFDVARIARDKKPRYLVLENVKGLLSHDRGNTFSTIIRTLTDLGYNVTWQVHNSRYFGVPQNRERVYIIGYYREPARPQILPIGNPAGAYKGENKQSYALYDISYPSRVRRYEKVAPTLRDYGSGGNKMPMVSRVPLRYLSSNQKNVTGDYAYTLDAQNSGGVMVEGSIRKLTPVECERLQGFPDGWTDGVSDTQRYKQLGNAVTVPVVQHVIEQMILLD